LHVTAYEAGQPVQYRVIAGSNMPTTPDWRNASAYAYLQQLNRVELAWEFLRRNANYIRDFRANARQASDETEFPERLTRRWGLRFPCRSAIAWRQGMAHLVAARRSCDGCCCTGTKDIR
jgi:hypothetical protein